MGEKFLGIEFYKWLIATGAELSARSGICVFGSGDFGALTRARSKVMRAPCVTLLSPSPAAPLKRRAALILKSAVGVTITLSAYARNQTLHTT